MNRRKNVSGLSDPYGELPLRNDKYASLCTELHLSNRNISQLANFNAFSQLSTLWINQNKLSKLEGLDRNVRLRNLHAHNNRITRLKGSSLVFFKFLEYLTLNDNLLENIPDVVGEIRHLRHLKNLDLFGNPISQEDNYRLQIIAEIPWLKTLDRVTITKSELNEAINLKSRLQKMMVLKERATSIESMEGNDGSSQQDYTRLETVLPYIKKCLRSKRIVLEERFLQDDPRKTGIVSGIAFQDALKQFGIIDILSEAEMISLRKKYRKISTVSGISPSNTKCREMINYRKFCDDFLPSGLRVHHPSFEKLDTWKMDVVPEVSVTANDLRRYVKNNRLRKEEEMRKSKCEALFAGSSSVDSNLAFAFSKSSACDERDSNMTEAWTQYMLGIFVLEEVNTGKDVGRTYDSISMALEGNEEFSKMNVRYLFERMSNHGKAPTVTVEKCLENIFQNDEVVTLNVLWSFLGPENNMTGKIIWRDLTDDEKEKKEIFSFEEAGYNLDNLLRCSSGGDSESEMKYYDLKSSTIQNALTGTRMASWKKVRATTKTSSNPRDIMQYAPNRSDIIVVPSLNSAALRAIKDQELKKSYDWESELSSLGMKGDALQIALTRKKRSILSFEKPKISQEKGSKNNNGKGWTTSTGTIIL